MTPAALQAGTPPLAETDPSIRGEPPSISILLNLLSATYAIERPSGDQTPLLPMFSVPGIRWGFTESIGRIQRPTVPSRFAAENRIREPSGEMEGKPAELQEVPSGSGTSKR